MEKEKYIIYIYNIINKKVMSDKIVIYNNLNNMLNNIKNMNDDIILFCYLDDMMDLNKRMNFLMNIEKLDMDMEIKSKIEIINYMILNNGSVKKIKDFNIVNKNLDVIKKFGIEELKKRDFDKERYRCEMEIKSKDNDIVTKMSYIVRLTNLYEIMEKKFDKNKDDMLEKLEEGIIQERENLLKNKVMRNEFDIINDAIKNALEKDEIDKLEIKKCIYNGVEISHGELIDELVSHVFPEFLEQKNIEDTMEDTYEIETNYLYIKRLVGGEIMIKKIDDMEK